MIFGRYFLAVIDFFLTEMTCANTIRLTAQHSICLDLLFRRPKKNKIADEAYQKLLEEEDQTIHVKATKTPGTKKIINEFLCILIV
jgi:hypothetical protein